MVKRYAGGSSFKEDDYILIIRKYILIPEEEKKC